MPSKKPITAYVAVKDGAQMLDRCLQSLSFCDQLIVVVDRSVDGTWSIAKKYTDEVYEWFGSDSMAERRNYAIGFEGNDRHSPEWLLSNEMLSDHPVVRNDWLMYLDHDELLAEDSGFPPIEEMIDSIIENEDEMEAYALALVNTMMDRQGTQQTQSPLMRVFKNNGKVWWEKAIQNEQRHGNPVGYVPIKLVHFGYGDHDYQFTKQWKRLEGIQNTCAKDTELMRIMYVINNLTGLVQNEKHIEELTAWFSFAKHAFLNSNETDKKDMQSILEACARHYWHGMSHNGRELEFAENIKPIMEYIDWIPDVPYWMFLVCMSQGDAKGEREWGEIFMRVHDEFHAGDWKNVELMCLGNRFLIPLSLCNSYSIQGKHKKAKYYDSKFKEWL